MRLRCVDNQEYLYPVDRDYTEDTRRRRVLTASLETGNSNAFDWLIETVDQPSENQLEMIRLSSVLYPGEFLLAGTDDLTVDSQRRKVYTWRETGTDFSGWGGPDEWCLLDKQKNTDDQTKFILHNKKFDEDLVGSCDRFEFDERFGTVFTWRNESANEKLNTWEIIPRNE